MATAEALKSGETSGGAFLLDDGAVESIFTPEDLDEEHRAIARTADEFYANEIAPEVNAIQRQEPGVAPGILRKSAELGLTGISIPEEYGGMELDLASSLLTAEHLGRDASYAAWHGAHTGIGTLPVLYFGTEAQKRRYLPKLASAEMIAAYALTEPHAGSDALSLRTRADLTSDGKHYVLNGQKMWITNGGAADLFTVFAKVNGTDMTAFLVERAFGGVTSGAEEKKMGIKGSSTTAVYFENVPVPVENVLGEVGRGHVIAFNILNMGRLSLGALAVGGAKDVLKTSLSYAKERQAFGKAIGSFGAIQSKLAEMAIRIFAAESVTWRVVGLVQNRLRGFSWSKPDAAKEMLGTLEEFAAECSLVKVLGSEVLDFVVDEGLQIHGGYGFHQDYAVERAYRDSRINRIFEGTNEINRLVMVGMLLKRAARGQLALMQAVEWAIAEGKGGAGEDGSERLVHNARKIALLAMALAQRRFKADLENQQEVMMSLADILLELFAMQSTYLRTERLRQAGKGVIAEAVCDVFLRDAMARIEVAARQVLGACAAGEALTAQMSILRKLARYEPVNAVELRRSIATHLLARGQYAL
jgi:butyryl-CoA dehydrogenase